MPSWEIIAKDRKALQQAIKCLDKLGYKYAVHALKIKIQAKTVDEMMIQAIEIKKCLQLEEEDEE